MLHDIVSLRQKTLASSFGLLNLVFSKGFVSFGERWIFLQNQFALENTFLKFHFDTFPAMKLKRFKNNQCMASGKEGLS